MIRIFFQMVIASRNCFITKILNKKSKKHSNKDDFKNKNPSNCYIPKPTHIIICHIEKKKSTFSCLEQNQQKKNTHTLTKSNVPLFLSDDRFAFCLLFFSFRCFLFIFYF